MIKMSKWLLIYCSTDWLTETFNSLILAREAQETKMKTICSTDTQIDRYQFINVILSINKKVAKT